MHVTTSSLKRHGLAALLLAFAVLFHVLCSAGHAAEASEIAPGSPIAASAVVEAQPSAEADTAVSSAHAHLVDGAHECAGPTEASAEPRGSALTALSLLLALGLAVLVAPWAARVPVYRRLEAREQHSRRRNAAPILLALCVWRI